MTGQTRDEDVINVDRAFQTAWIVYINGLEVPVVSVSVNYGVWQIPEAEITMVPDPVLERLGAEDRVAVQVFYCDYWHEPENPQFRLMFDGEIVGWSYVNVQQARAISFSCVDYVQIFTQLFFFFMSNVDDIATGVSNQEIGVNINGVLTPGFSAIYPYSLFAQGLTGEGSGESGGPKDLITRPIDYVYNIVRALIDNETPNRSVPAANFFAPWARRTKFHRRFTAIPFLEEADDPGIFPILRAVRADFAVAAVSRLASNIGSSASIWHMLQQVLQTVMVELAMLPTANAAQAKYDTLQPTGPAGEQSKGTNPILLNNYFVKPQFLFGIPPACNVFFPSQIQQLAYNENYITQPTRMYFNDEAWMTLLNTQATQSEGFNTMVRDALAVAHPEEVNQAARNAVERPGENAKNILVYPEEFFKGPVVDRRALPRWFMFLANAQQDAGEGDSEPSKDVAPGDSERDVYRLYAKYEFFKERYARRTGTVQLAFNPYPVPGFPCAAFDRRSSKVDVIGYVMNVRQNMSNRGWTTSVTYSYGRTLREMFALMRRQFVTENEAIDDELNEIEESQKRVENEGLTKEREDLRQGRPEKVGAVATAPPEPLREVRDVIQNFQRAEAFYRSLFFSVEAPEGDELSQDQLQAEVERRKAEGDVPDQQPKKNSPEPTVSTPEELPNRAAFFYNEIIQLVDGQGNKEDIQLEGIDATARSKILATVEKMRKGTATDEEIDFVSESVGREDLPQQPETGDPSSVTAAILNTIEKAVLSFKVKSNVRGDRFIEPKKEAAHLFNSYESAMRYNSRPICTLEEYIRFLGEDASPEGKVDPQEALLHNDPRTFPAPYYQRIRKYRPGPPDELPEQNITNTNIVTGVDGVASLSETEAEGDGETQQTVNSLPEDFPENSANWDIILLAYRNNVLVKLAPKT